MLAPIVIFAFNRPEALKACVASLLLNTGAKDSDLYIYVDGPRSGNQSDSVKVEEVRSIAKGIIGFKSVRTFFATENKGLGASVIFGVSEVVNKYGRAIVVEDDLQVASNFLPFMNKGLDMYEGFKEVFSICGYSNRLRVQKDILFDAYFGPRSSSWGWATWKDRWDLCDWKLSDWKAVRRNAWGFNRWGGSDCYKMLKDWKEGRNNSWAIRFCYNQFVQDKVSLFPFISKVVNNGFDGSGTNCGRWSRFKSDFDTTGSKEFRFPEDIVVTPSHRKQILAYHSLVKRVYSRIMYMVYR